METGMNRPYGKVLKGHTHPYGSMVGITPELKSAIYHEGYARDEDMPELPRPPRDNSYDHTPELEDRIDAARLCELLASNLKHKRHYPVMYMVEGLDMTLDKVGNLYGVTRERIRQINRQALRESRRLLIRTKARLK